MIPLWDRVRDEGAFGAIGGELGVDGFSLFVTAIIASSVVLVAMLLDGYLRREDMTGPEMYVLLLLSAAGGVVMAGANDLIVMFLGLETLSIAVYVMAAMHLRKVVSLEAGLKYFRARRLLVGVSALWHRLGVWRNGHHESGRHPLLSRGDHHHRRRHAARWPGAAAGGSRLQDRRRALSTLGLPTCIKAHRLQWWRSWRRR